MSKFKVAVFGDYMVDRYWIGEASGLSAEVPIPVVKIKKSMDFQGGAGNVAKNLESLGCEIEKIGAHWLPYPVKNRLMVGDIQLARWDENDYCFSYVPKQFPEVDAIIVADYGKGAIDKATIEAIKSVKEVFDTPIFVDTKRDPSVWSGVATAIFPNEKEHQQFIVPYGMFQGNVILKRGEKGLALFYPGQINLIDSPSQARFIRSVNGAGDTVIAAFVYKYLKAHQEAKEFCKGQEYEIIWQAMLDFANAAAAIACENPYTYAPTLEEIEERCDGE